MYGMTDEDVERSFELVYKSAFKDMVDNHVRPEMRAKFFVNMAKTLNQVTSSTVWGALLDVAEEYYGKEFAESLLKR